MSSWTARKGLIYEEAAYRMQGIGGAKLILTLRRFPLSKSMTSKHLHTYIASWVRLQ